MLSPKVLPPRVANENAPNGVGCVVVVLTQFLREFTYSVEPLSPWQRAQAPNVRTQAAQAAIASPYAWAQLLWPRWHGRLQCPICTPV
tara:strand:- start:946 stop:1209 length:264 start_codon:yes stop_codon:yes gene_type:complete